jgi:hypothetical protein
MTEEASTDIKGKTRRHEVANTLIWIFVIENSVNSSSCASNPVFSSCFSPITPFCRWYALDTYWKE